MFDALKNRVKSIAAESAKAYIEGRYDIDKTAQKALDELDLPYECDFKTIKKRYLELSKIFHPDVRGQSTHERFLRIKEAYDVLKSAHQKKEANE